MMLQSRSTFNLRALWRAAQGRSPSLNVWSAPAVGPSSVHVRNRSVFLLCVTHIIGFDKTVADRVFFIGADQSIEDNEPEESFNNPQNERT